VRATPRLIGGASLRTPPPPLLTPRRLKSRTPCAATFRQLRSQPRRADYASRHACRATPLQPLLNSAAESDTIFSPPPAPTPSRCRRMPPDASRRDMRSDATLRAVFIVSDSEFRLARHAHAIVPSVRSHHAESSTRQPSGHRLIWFHYHHRLRLITAMCFLTGYAVSPFFCLFTFVSAPVAARALCAALQICSIFLPLHVALCFSVSLFMRAVSAAAVLPAVSRHRLSSVFAVPIRGLIAITAPRCLRHAA